MSKIESDLAVLELIPPIEPKDEESCNEADYRQVRYIDLENEEGGVYCVSDFSNEAKYRMGIDGWSPLVGTEAYLIRDGKAIRINVHDSKTTLEEVRLSSKTRNPFN